MEDQKLWELWRQDDNGNQFLIEAFDTREDAEAKQAELESHPHKQIYWIRERETS